MIDWDFSGRMISASKSNGPKGHVCVWNANVCIKSAGKIWYGDIDLTADIESIKALAVEKGEDVYVLREMDARFQTQNNPRYENAVAVISPSGAVVINEDNS
jgi:hypothetical protein